jgi:hypothetical protein
VASKSHRAAIRPPPEFAVAPPQSARAPLPYRRCTDEYGGIEYGGLPVNCGRIRYHVVLHSNSMLSQFADNLTINDLCTAPEGFKSRHETGKAWAMMHPMKFEDPDGFRRTPVSAPLPPGD